MTKVIVISGFLGAGKTTCLNKVLPLLSGKKAVLENEFGETGIDGYLINEEVPVLEMVKGCICCSLLTEFKKGLKNILSDIGPQWLLIEPSGVSTLSGILEIIDEVKNEEGNISDIYKVTMAESPVFMDFSESFGEFYKDQIKFSDAVFLTKNELIEEETGNTEEEELTKIAGTIVEINPEAEIITDDFRKLDNDFLLQVITGRKYRTDFNCHDENQDKKDSGNKDEFITEDKDRGSIPRTEGRRIDFSSLSLRDVFMPDRKATENMLHTLFSGKYGKILRIKGHITEGKERIFISATTAAHTISSISDSKNILVIIGEKIDRKGISQLFRKKSIAGKLVNRKKK